MNAARLVRCYFRILSSPSPKSSILRPNPNPKPKTVKIQSPIGTGSDTKIQQANRIVLHNQGEDYQQPINFKSGRRQSYSCPELNLIQDQYQSLGLTLYERQVQFPLASKSQCLFRRSRILESSLYSFFCDFSVTYSVCFERSMSSKIKS